jgi:hypothetical protein
MENAVDACVATSRIGEGADGKECNKSLRRYRMGLIALIRDLLKEGNDGNGYCRKFKV